MPVDLYGTISHIIIIKHTRAHLGLAAAGRRGLAHGGTLLLGEPSDERPL